jgi:hypothetical protein
MASEDEIRGYCVTFTKNTQRTFSKVVYAVHVSFVYELAKIPNSDQSRITSRNCMSEK